MTPHRYNQRGTFVIHRRFPGVGRIKRASGSKNMKMFNALNAMLNDLYHHRRIDLLRDIQAKRFSPLQVWDAYGGEYDRERLDSLYAEPASPALQPVWTTWVEQLDCGDAYRRDVTRTGKLLAADDATMDDLHERLKAYRFQCMRRGTRRSFNAARAHVRGFLRDELGSGEKLYTRIVDMKPLKVERKDGNPQEPQQAREIRLALGEHGDTWWSMVTTGMGPKEYWGKWQAGQNSVRIFGTKRDARRRNVPLLCRPTPPSTETPSGFAQALRKAVGDVVEPYDARRTYAHWLEMAGIPRTRRKMYMGHRAGDVTELYERHEVARFLDEDAERLRQYLGDVGRLSVVNGGQTR